MNTPKNIPVAQRGFTLIEVMVVVVILAILAGVVGANVFGSLSSSKIKTTKIQLENVKGALQTYYLDNNKYPTTGQGLDALITPVADAKNFQDGGYLDGSEYPLDSWDNELQYISDGRSFELFSLGADGMEGGEGDDADIYSK